eukprot:3990258-Pyramimonas_sp.AAC.1
MRRCVPGVDRQAIHVQAERHTCKRAACLHCRKHEGLRLVSGRRAPRRDTLGRPGRLRAGPAHVGDALPKYRQS